MPRIDWPIPAQRTWPRISTSLPLEASLPRYTETANASPEHRRPTNKRRSLRDKDNYLSMNPGVMTDVLPRPTIPLLVFTPFSSVLYLYLCLSVSFQSVRYSTFVHICLFLFVSLFLSSLRTSICLSSSLSSFMHKSVDLS